MTPLAHGSGIDDAIIVLVPLAIVVVMLRMGARKVPPEDEAGLDQPDSGGPAAAPGAPDPGDGPAAGGTR